MSKLSVTIVVILLLVIIFGIWQKKVASIGNSGNPFNKDCIGFFKRVIKKNCVIGFDSKLNKVFYDEKYKVLTKNIANCIGSENIDTLKNTSIERIEINNGNVAFYSKEIGSSINGVRFILVFLKDKNENLNNITSTNYETIKEIENNVFVQKQYTGIKYR